MTATLTVYRRSELEGADCLFRYKNIWLDGVDDSSDYALRGQAFAAIKYRYIVLLREASLGQDDELSQTAFIEGIAHSRCPERLIPEVRELWERHARNFELPLDRFLSAEEKQLPVLCQSCGADFAIPEIVDKACPSCGKETLTVRPFVFTPDLVLVHPERNELEIIDDKTFFVALTPSQAKASFQGRFYTRFAMQRWPNFSSYRFTFNFVRLGRMESVVYTDEDLSRLDLEVKAAVARIQEAHRTGRWEATAGPSCNFCELNCPIMPKALTTVVPKRLIGIEPARALGEMILAAEQWTKVAKKTLKGYCGIEGAVDVNGVEWDNRPVQQRAYPVADVLKVLQDRGRMGAFESEDLTLSHSALAKLFKAYPQLEEDLSPHLRAKTTYRFSAKKPGVGDDDAE